MRYVYVVGGRQREGRPLLARPSWYEYEAALVLRVDVETGQATTCLEYVSPPDVRAEGTPPILFKCASLHAGELYLCTHSEILVYRESTFERTAYVSLPMFNDLHYVRPTPDGNILAVNTGLDMVVEITRDGAITREWGVLGDDPWTRFSRSVDYRKIPSTKPHRSHPNYLFYLGDELWVTRFEQKDAISLTDRTRRIDIGIERVHDGVLQDERLYFTTVKGDVVVVNARTLQIEDVIDLTQMHPEGTLLGWCRGLMTDGNRVWVAFSHIRPTRFRENIGWIAHGFRRALPTHIACFDLIGKRLLSVVELERYGLDAIFSILPSGMDDERSLGQRAAGA